mgnify:CR=1 FL=1
MRQRIRRCVARIFRGRRRGINLQSTGPSGPVCDAWVRDRGDATLRLEYALPTGAIIWDAGAFHGDWASAIAARSDGPVHMFEPIPSLQDSLRKRFAGKTRFNIHGCALGRTNGQVDFVAAGDASSTSVPSVQGDVIRVPIRDVASVWQELGAIQVALLKINIEGGEYDLLERLLETGLVGQFQHLQVQFHRFVPDAEKRRDFIRTGLAHSHEERWCYPWVWESWTLK